MIDPFITLMPNYVDMLGADPALVGGLTSSFGIGSVLGLLVMSRISIRFPSRVLGPIGLAGLSIALVSLAWSSAPTPAIVIAALAGLMVTVGRVCPDFG